MDNAFDILLIEGGAGREPDRHILGDRITSYSLYWFEIYH